MSRHQKRDRDNNRRNRRDRDRDRNDRFDTQRESDLDRSGSLGSSATATLDTRSGDPIISGGRSSTYEHSESHDRRDEHEINDDPITAVGQSTSRDHWDHHEQDDDFGSDHDDNHDGDRYGYSVTYHDDSYHSYGSSDSNHDSHDDLDHVSLVAPSSDFF